MGKLEGKIAIITGGASGIGKATTKRFVDEGAKVCMVDLKREALEASAADLGLPEGSYVIAPADVTNEEQVKAAIDTCVKTFGTRDQHHWLLLAHPPLHAHIPGAG